MSISLYVHVPFCLTRCPYCAFYSGESLELLPRFPTWVREEIALRSPSHEKRPAPATTVYFGGGTPSLLGPVALSRILNSLDRSFGLAGDAEVTLEANPGDDLDFSEVRTAGVTRLSVGVQSLDDRVLQHLGRRHSAAAALRTVASASDAGLRTSADLMFGLEMLRPQRLIEDVERLRAAGAEHLSVYSLEVHPATPLSGATGSQKPDPASPAAEEDQWAALDAALRSNGLQPYEVSNYCLPGAEARHNLAYWEGSAYVGLGPGAHSYTPSVGRWGTRSWNKTGLLAYADAVETGRLPPDEQETLTRGEALLEALFLSLRRPVSVDFRSLAARFGIDLPGARTHLIQAAREGLLAPSSDRPDCYAATADGMRAADGLALWLRGRFVPAS